MYIYVNIIIKKKQGNVTHTGKTAETKTASEKALLNELKEGTMTTSQLKEHE